jgi:hypothetical protein
MMYSVDFVLHGHFYVDDIEADSKEEAMEYANEVFSMTDFGSLWDIDGEIYSVEDENGEVCYEL